MILDPLVLEILIYRQGMQAGFKGQTLEDWVEEVYQRKKALRIAAPFSQTGDSPTPSGGEG